MPQVHRVLDPELIPDLDTYLANGGGRGLAVAAEVDAAALIDVVERAGLRGRGGAGFPTAIKWRTVVDNRSSAEPTTVIVNAAEGEPGTFKDRAILRTNPYRVLEGALIAARAVDAPQIVVALKHSFTSEAARVRRAIDELTSRGLADIAFRVVEGPSEYLFGEESAMLEVVEGRHPFPRVTPPYRRGVDEQVEGAETGNSAAWVGLAAAGGTSDAPALVDNVETLANVPSIVAEGPDWFRSLGTAESPGTIVCTITGATARHGVGEFAMGTPMWDVIDALGGGPEEDRTLVAAISGTANAVLTADRFDTPLSYEAMAAAGTGLGTGGFIVFDDATDLVAVAHAISRFLAVESCGQCEPCKDDGLRISEHLDAIRRSAASARDLEAIDARLTTVANGARCALAGQQQYAVGSLLALARDQATAHIAGAVGPADRVVIAPILDIVDGRAVLDETQLAKQPDWTMDETDSGATPVGRFGDEQVAVTVTRRDDPRVAAGDRWAPGAGAAVDDDDPFTSVRARHAELLRDLAAVGEAPSGEDRTTALATLDHHLRQYVDLTGRVLYPMLSRATAGSEDVAWAAEHDAARALTLSEQLTAAGGDDAQLLAALRDEIAELMRTDEEIALPLLLGNLDGTELDELAAALAEVDEAPREPSASTRFGTSPG